MITGKPILDRAKATREQWLALHDQHIGGSDAAAVMGLSRFQSPMSVYAVKKHMLPHQEESSAMRWGNILEGVIRQEFPKDFALQEHKVVDVIEDTWMYEHPEHSYMCCDPDGVVMIGDREGTGLLEIKTTTGHSAGDWKDDSVPDEYFAQCQHNMFVMGLSWALIVVLMDKKLLWRIVPRRTGFIEEMLAAEKEWWHRYYLADEMPAPSGMEIDTSVLHALYPSVEEREIELPHLEPLALRYQELAGTAKQAEEERREIQQIFLKEMGEAQRAFAGRARASRSVFSQARLDVDGLRREHPIIAARFQKETQQSRITITVPKEKGEVA